jgi:hypothetical protein
MRKLSFLIIPFILSISFPVSSETVELELPDLLGDYSGPQTTKHCTFVLNPAPNEVYSVFIYLSGSVTVGETYCQENGPPPVGPYPSPMEFIAYMDDPLSGDFWWASCLTDSESGSFEFTLQFEPFSTGDPTWEFLLSGSGTVDLEGLSGGLIPECWHEVEPEAIIEEALLWIETDSPIAVESHTWGSIKSLIK